MHSIAQRLAKLECFHLGGRLTHLCSEPAGAVEREAKRYRAAQGGLRDADFLTVGFDEKGHDVGLSVVDHRKQTSAIAITPVGGLIRETDVGYRSPFAHVSSVESDLTAEHVRASAQRLRVFRKLAIVGLAIPRSPRLRIR